LRRSPFRARHWLPRLVIILLLLAYFLVPAAKPGTTDNPIVAENLLPGSEGWRVGQSGFQVSTDVGGQVQGYASSTSLARGENLTFYVTVSPAQQFSIDIYRMGWYGGAGGRLVTSAGPLDGVQQLPCPIAAETGTVACDWAPSLNMSIPQSWPTGVYVAVLTNAAHFQSQVIFVVRDDTHVGGLLYVQPVNTYQAYNEYPSDGLTGKSLYDAFSHGSETIAGTERALKVSFDRPYSQGNGSGLFFSWEFNLIRFLERAGYDVSYMTDVDFDVNGHRPLRARGVVIAGHDEYWTKAMFDALVNARDAGINLAFAGANAGYWQVRLEPSSAGVPRRVVVCYRDASLDPEPNPALKTVQWREPPVDRNEQRLIGVQYTALLNRNASMVITNPQHWLYSNTGFRDGDTVGGIVGYEVDTAMQQFASPDAVRGTYELLSSSPVVDETGRAGIANSSIYKAPGGGWVFAAGTMSWSWALDAAGYYDVRLERATQNLFDTFISGKLPQPVAAPPPSSTAYSRTVQADRPVAYWRLADTSGWHATDATGGMRDGLMSGGLIRAMPGALDGDANTATGSDGSARIILPTLPPVQDFTIEGWTRLADASWNADLNYNNTLYGVDRNVRLLIRPGVSGGPASALGFFGLWLEGVEYEIQPPNNGLDNVGQWVHWAMTRQANVLSIYRNGALVGQRTDLPATALANISGQLFVEDTGFPLKGGLDDVAVYTSALPAARVAAHYVSARPPRPAAAPTPGRQQP
jgi:hypothetical protein